MLFYHRSSEILARLGPELRIFMPAVLRTGQKRLKRHKKFKNDPNDVNPSRGVILCDIFARKIPNLEYYQYIKKPFTKMTFHFRGFMAFRSNDKCYGYNRRIVCDNVPILCTHVHPGMTINVEVEVLLFVAPKMYFLFSECQKWVIL